MSPSLQELKKYYPFIGIGLLIITLIIIIIYLSKANAEIKDVQNKSDKSDKLINESKDQNEKDFAAIRSDSESQYRSLMSILGWKNGRKTSRGYLTPWSDCSATCGGGVQIRTYYPAIPKDDEDSGIEDKDKNVLVQQCNMHACPTTDMPLASGTSTFTNYNDWLKNKLSSIKKKIYI